MPRRNRSHPAEVLAHVISRGVHGDPLCPHDDASGTLWNAIGRYSREFEVPILSLCIMGSHYHLLTTAGDEAISEMLHRAHSKLANTRNVIEKRRGAVFGRRFKLVTVDDEVHTQRVLRYVPMNPVRHRLCKHPVDWYWSTHAVLLGRRRKPAWFDSKSALRAMGFPDADAYNRFVLAGSPHALPPMSKGQLTQHNARIMAMYGASTPDIAEALRISPRHARRLVNGATVVPRDAV